MPIIGAGWEIHVERHTVQRRSTDGKKRTVGRYAVFHDGTAVPALAGTTAESHGPGINDRPQTGTRILPGRYPLATQDGTKYCTIGYTSNTNQAALRRPSIELLGTGARREILIHPGIGFLASIGCINLCTRLPDEREPISFPGSRNRVIAAIEDLIAYLGASFPAQNGRSIPNAHCVIDGEP